MFRDLTDNCFSPDAIKVQNILEISTLEKVCLFPENLVLLKITFISQISHSSTYQTPTLADLLSGELEGSLIH